MLQQPYQQGYMSVYILAAMKVLGEQATLALIKPYLDARTAYTLSSGVGLVTKTNLARTTQKLSSFGISSSMSRGRPTVAVELVGVQKIYGPVRVLNIDDLGAPRRVRSSASWARTAPASRP